jgi:hypothetical protein
LHPTHLPSPHPPAPLRSGDGCSAGKWAGECGVMRRNEKKYIMLRKVICICILLSILGCEIDTKVRMDNKNPPTFSLTGSGVIYFFVVSEILSKNEPGSKSKFLYNTKELWKIEPASSEIGRIFSLPKILYGELPEGFKQVLPEKGNPESLLEGKVYSAGAPSYNANGGGIRFIIKGGNLIEIDNPDKYLK